jgi:hypothetical protein
MSMPMSAQVLPSMCVTGLSFLMAGLQAFSYLLKIDPSSAYAALHSAPDTGLAAAVVPGTASPRPGLPGLAPRPLAGSAVQMRGVSVNAGEAAAP